MISESELIRIGRIIGSHALDGKLKVFVVSDLPERFQEGNAVLLKLKDGLKEFKIIDFRFLKGSIALLKLGSISSRTEADMMKNIDIFIDDETAEKGRTLLEENTFFYRDLIGASVYQKDSLFGTVKDIFEAGSGDILVIEDLHKKEILIPFVESMVNTDRLKDKIIDINPVEGLLDF